jgi:ribosomal-protein-alanine N-acetyltransferase
MRLIPITTDAVEMQNFIQHEFTKGAFEAWLKMYPLWGFHLPWVGYFVIQNDQAVGVGGFKGQPRNNTVELAYGTVPEFGGNGIGSNTCRLLVECALDHAPDVRITSRTLP